MTVANSLLFANAVFNEFKKPESERDENRLIRYMDLALKARDMEIRAGAVQLGYQRFRFATARTLPNGEPEPSPAENRKKMEKAMLLLFGEEPEGFVSEAGLPVAETARGIALRNKQANSP